MKSTYTVYFLENNYILCYVTNMKKDAMKFCKKVEVYDFIEEMENENGTSDSVHE